MMENGAITEKLAELHDLYADRAPTLLAVIQEDAKTRETITLSVRCFSRLANPGQHPEEVVVPHQEEDSREHFLVRYKFIGI
jgi:hypothetical protein